MARQKKNRRWDDGQDSWEFQDRRRNRKSKQDRQQARRRKDLSHEEELEYRL